MKLTETLSAIYDARLQDPDSDFWSFWFLNILTMLLRKEKIYTISLCQKLFFANHKPLQRYLAEHENSLPLTELTTELTTDILQSLK